MSAVTRVHRIVVTAYPTPDGRPFDLQHPNDYETAAELFHNPGAPLDCPAWLKNIDLSERLYAGNSYDDGGHGPLPGTTIMGSAYDPVCTVPTLRRTNFFSKQAAERRLSYLTDWGATGYVESSGPIEWPSAPAPVADDPNLPGQLTIDDAA
ncbi:hypothetical protein SEA_VIBAKI_69 [Arthrobacter phage Vibaki]|uniref:Uncharacterized protein n=1 Tax=Arthrobacter phage Vibaki TaxID=2593333 RepID=A0A514TZ27_9CAUD|nr:hypothetical protein HYP95_gp69 [Arthrobacter phage Vibaki]QDK01949.1 hypothetical protein SEA_VIBAKI_69 [Arthrobacter phage Vibaki]